MSVGRLGILGWFAAVALALFACGDDEDDGVKNGGSCEAGGGETDLCVAWVRRELACGTAAEPEEALLARCRADWEEYPNRVASCFVTELAECLWIDCGSEDRCYTDALVANDPSLVDVERYRECRENHRWDCEDLPRGFLKACLARADECEAFDDLCASASALKPPYRGEAEACVARPCAELEGCLFTAMGRTARATPAAP